MEVDFICIVCVCVCFIKFHDPLRVSKPRDSRRTYFYICFYGVGHVCGDTMDIIDGRPTGAVRFSMFVVHETTESFYVVDV
jgi:hypothetical protein